MHIRPYVPTDQDRALEIWLGASRACHPFLGEAVLREQLQDVRDTYLPTADTWIAEVEGRIEGVIGLLGRFIGGLFVDPGAHGAGIGSALVEHAAARHRVLTVSVYADNRQAVAFYQRCGFVETARREQDDEGRPLQTIEMRREA
ncbi:MAG: GNAT family N-acetyltransferase [Bradyrhizobium sp.]